MKFLMKAIATRKTAVACDRLNWDDEINFFKSLDDDYRRNYCCFSFECDNDAKKMKKVHKDLYKELKGLFFLGYLGYFVVENGLTKSN